MMACNEDGNGEWTNEKHLDFLSVMEATFVRTMLTAGGGGGKAAGAMRRKIVRMDRHVPDVSESTSDRRKNSRGDGVAAVMDISKRRRHLRGAQCRLHKVPRDQDQVVPQAMVIDAQTESNV